MSWAFVTRSSLPILATYKHLKTTCQHLQPSHVLLSWSYGRPNIRVETLYNCTIFLLASSQYLSTHFSHVLPYRVTTRLFLREVSSHPSNFSIVPAESRDSNILLCSTIIFSFDLHSRWVLPKYTWSRNRFFKINQLRQFLPHKTQILLFLAILMSSTFSDEQSPCFRWTVDIPSSVLFPFLVPIELRPNCLSHNKPAIGWPHRFQEEPPGTQKS